MCYFQPTLWSLFSHPCLFTSSFSLAPHCIVPLFSAPLLIRVKRCFRTPLALCLVQLVKNQPEISAVYDSLGSELRSLHYGNIQQHTVLTTRPHQICPNQVSDKTSTRYTQSVAILTPPSRNCITRLYVTTILRQRAWSKKSNGLSGCEVTWITTKNRDTSWYVRQWSSVGA